MFAMASRFFLYRVRRSSLSSLLHFPSPTSFSFRSDFYRFQSIHPPSAYSNPFNLWKPTWVFRHLSHGTVNLILSQGKPKFETHEIEPPKRKKWQTKKRLKMKRKKEKQKRKSANKRDPRHLGVKGKKKKKKQKFPNAEARIKYKIEMAKVKEALLIERLKRYEVPKLQGPTIEPENLTGEERFYMKKMAQKRSNYVPVGRRGVFGGVILNMHLHWKKHETVKVICQPCKPGQVNEYAKEIARLSGGTPIQIIGNDTIIFYRGKDYVQPEVMSPIDTLSKKRALEKSKYEQSLESVRRFIAISEKELELYYRHVALYGDPNSRDSNSVSIHQRKGSSKPGELEPIEKKSKDADCDGSSTDPSESDIDCGDEDLYETEADSTGEDLLEN
ncbi:RNA-binding CRS1 / YhbY (CRM) domain protein isoform X2 [Tasmannia lanceolata]|uniref:RNA-binding CRS1 / YhbY (CRM) domain protein isoform X2 n=1 Tax=Tasmannia lanceolata TaxID=3420 RepID=UPI004064AC0C